MLRPRKMRYLELTVMKNDMDAVLEYLGKRAAVQFPVSASAESQKTANISSIMEKLRNTAAYLSIGIEPESGDEAFLPGEEDQALAENICMAAELLMERESQAEREKERICGAMEETDAFSRMNAPFSDLEHLSYLTLRIGRLDPKNLSALRESLQDRAVIIPLEQADTDASLAGEKIFAASSRKGRFALDSQLNKFSFEPAAVPADYKGVPSQILSGLKTQLAQTESKLEIIRNEKENLRNNASAGIKRLISSWQTAYAIEEIKSRFTVTDSVYHFSGWTPADRVKEITGGLLELTGGRIAIRTYSPHEVPSIRSGSEKVPVSMKHGAFVKGFEPLVFSYGAPLYGTIDPTPVVAFFFTIIFGIMFGDAGQGAVLLIAGILIKKIPGLSAKFANFSTPLVAIGVSSMIMGFLAGSVFTNEKLLTVPTMALTGAITGHPVERILHILPMAEEGGSITKLLYFFGFTVCIGVIINSLGLIINIYNRFTLKKYDAAIFSKTGLAGMLMFWYALSIAVRLLLGGSFQLYDFAGLLIPLFFIFFGPVIWRIISGKRPVLEEGLFLFIMEGFVEVLETVSNYVSNTVSFLRVGAFALSHAVLSYIVFRFTEDLAFSSVTGTFSAILIMLLGNSIIIVLEGMIVAIQVIRLQYYEFFNKFFIETGVEFAPFRFKIKNIKN
ncbi:MAG: V-type ATP synthase subunit I [Treponema sp.]|jgi:V/A-type H+-transporting ATPase subunit I|nr:V-type ATP synthase subunit I [Treponema sp.]